jgi:hypothetical protein
MERALYTGSQAVVDIEYVPSLEAVITNPFVRSYSHFLTVLRKGLIELCGIMKRLLPLN